MHQVVVFHHARPEHVEDFLAFMALLECSSWRESERPEEIVAADSV